MNRIIYLLSAMCFLIWIFCPVSFIYGSDLSSSTENLHENINSLPELPEQPTVTGVRFVVWYTLRDLYQAIHSSYLNPGDPDYIYKEYKNFSSESSLPFLTHIALYKAIREDYYKFLALPNVDSYNESNLPSPLNARVALAKAVYSYFLLARHTHSKLLTIFHKTMWDHRFIHEFFFSYVVDRRHKPLESIVSLSRSSVRTQKVVSRILGAFYTEMSLLASQAHQFAEQVLSSEELNREKFANFKQRSEENVFRLRYMMEKLYQAIQQSNDIVRDKNIKNRSDLEFIMASLGQGLRLSFQDIQSYRKAQEEGRLFDWRKGDGIYLSNIADDLKKLFGVDANYAFLTFSSRLFPRSRNTAYEIYQDSITMQYILAAGAAMAKISDISEGRGSLRQRVLQEVDYRKAQVSQYFGRTSQSSSKSFSQDLVLTSDQAILENLPPQRRDFAAPALQSDREALEEKLWHVFFENAGLLSQASQSSFMIQSRLLEQTSKLQSQNCKSFFR